MTDPEFNILMSQVEEAAKIKNEIQDLKCALTWLKSSAFHFRLGRVQFSEVPPGFSLPDETWKRIREEISSAIESIIKELKQQFKEL